MSTTTLSAPITTGRFELATVAAAAQSKALVEAKFTIAMHRPRSILDARARILEACKRPAFAERAWYAKPVGTGKVRGPSIRFAEEAIRAMTNITVICNVLHDDELKRIISIEVIDLETNTSFGDTVTINKTVERKKASDREVLGQRVNSFGDTVFIVAATEDELGNKINAAKSKVIRNSGLRLVPQDLIDEAEEVVKATLANGGSDPKAAVRKMADAFSELGIKPGELERYLGHPIEASSPSEIAGLREAFAAIRDGEATWGDYLEQKRANGTPSAKPNLFGGKTVEPFPLDSLPPAIPGASAGPDAASSSNGVAGTNVAGAEGPVIAGEVASSAQPGGTSPIGNTPAAAQEVTTLPSATPPKTPARRTAAKAETLALSAEPETTYQRLTRKIGEAGLVHSKVELWLSKNDFPPLSMLSQTDAEQVLELFGALAEEAK